MAQLNILPVEISQTTDFKSEMSGASSEGKSRDDSFSALVDRHLASEKSGKDSSHVNKDGNKLSKEDQQPIAKPATKDQKELKELSSEHEEVSNAQASDKESIDIQAPIDEKPVENENLLEGKNNQNALSQLEQSENFLSLVDSATKILHGNIDGNEKAGQQVEGQANAALKDLISQQQTMNNSISGEKNTTKDSALLAINDELATKVSQSIKGEQQKLSSGAKELLEANNKQVPINANNEQSEQLTSDTSAESEKLNEQLMASTKNLAGKVTTVKEKTIPVNTVSIEHEAKTKTIKSDSVISDDAIELLKTVESSANQLKSNDQIKALNDGQSGAEIKQPVKLSQSLSTSSDKNITTAIGGASVPSDVNNLDGKAHTSIQVEAMVQASGISSKGLAAKVDSQANIINNLVEAKAGLSDKMLEQNSAQSQSNDSSSEEQTNQSEAMLQAAQSNQSIDNKSPVVNSSFALGQTSSQITEFSSSATQASHLQDFQSSQAAIDDFSSTIVNDNITQAKNNAATLSETISIFRKDFAEAVKDKVMVLISQKLQQFDIRLDPPELGNVHVRVNLQNEQAVVNFIVQNQQAKEAFEENLGKLKEMLAEHGVDVGDASVEQQAQQSSDDENGSSSNGKNRQGDNNELASVDTVLTADLFKNSSSGVDYYA